MFTKEVKPVYVTIQDIQVDVDTIPDGSVTLEDYKTARANTAGSKALYPKLNDEALCYAVQNTLNNCGYKLDVTYEGVLENTLVPLLLKRFKER